MRKISRTFFLEKKDDEKLQQLGDVRGISKSAMLRLLIRQGKMEAEKYGL